MNKSGTKILVSLVALIVIAGFVYAKQNHNHKTMKIGILLPSTGKFATYGADMQAGLTVALGDIKEDKNINFELIYEDTAADPKTALNAANKLIQIDKVPLIIGGTGSSANLAVAPIMETSQTIFSVISLTPKLNESGVYTMKFQQDIDEEVFKLIEYIKPLKYKSVAVVYDSASDTQTTGKDIFIKEFEKTGSKISYVEGFDSKNISDYRSLLAKVKNSNPDSLYLLAVDKTAGAVLKQAREIGFVKPIYGMSALDSYEFARTGQESVEGVTFTAYPFSCDRDSVTAKYCDDFKELVSGAEPLQYGAYAYDILTLIAKAVEKHGFEKEKILEELISTKDYEGISGKITLDSKGNLIDTDYVIKTVKNGKFEVIE